MSVPHRTRQRPTLGVVREFLSQFYFDDSSRVESIHEGPNYSSWVVHGPPGMFVLRMALDETTSARETREVQLRTMIAFFSTTILLPFTFTRCTWTEGLTCTLESTLWRASANITIPSTLGLKDLANLLSTMRAVPAFMAADIGVPVSEPRSIGPLRKAATRAAQNLADVESQILPLFETLYKYTEEQLAAQPDKVLVHNSMMGDNILVLSNGRVCGLLNWADATIGDPAEGIACLAISLGAIAAVNTARMARYPVAVCLRALCLARCDTLLRLDLLQNNHNFARLRLQLGLAWQPTQFDPVS
jgi:aminoglycoside phosphotransferase (APT) family kinase protein